MCQTDKGLKSCMYHQLLENWCFHVTVWLTDYTNLSYWENGFCLCSVLIRQQRPRRALTPAVQICRIIGLISSTVHGTICFKFWIKEGVCKPQSKTRNVPFPNDGPQMAPSLSYCRMTGVHVFGCASCTSFPWVSALLRAGWAIDKLSEPECWRGSGRRYWLPVSDAESWPGWCLCCRSVVLSTCCWSPSKGHRNTKGILVLGGELSFHLALGWQKNTECWGFPSSLLCWMPFLGQEATLGLTDVLVMVKLSLPLISSGMGLKVPPPVSERTGLHSQIIDLNSSISRMFFRVKLA